MSDQTPFLYSRWANPTTALLEQKLTVFEKTETCITFESSMAASAAVMLNYLSSGDHLIISNTNYPGTAEFARDTLTRLGVSATPVDTSDIICIEQAG
jgi:methionine-gamma-lyase